MRRFAALVVAALALPAFAQQGQPSTVQGKVEKADEHHVRLALPDGKKAEVSVGSDTQVLKAGEKLKADELKKGTDVRATYVGGQAPHATRIEVLTSQDQAAGTAGGTRMPNNTKDAKAGGSNYRSNEGFYGGQGGATDSESGVGTSPGAREQSGSAGAPGQDGKSDSGTQRAPNPTYQTTPRSPEERRRDRAGDQGTQGGQQGGQQQGGQGSQ